MFWGIKQFSVYVSVLLCGCREWFPGVFFLSTLILLSYIFLCEYVIFFGLCMNIKVPHKYTVL